MKNYLLGPGLAFSRCECLPLSLNFSRHTRSPAALYLASLYGIPTYTHRAGATHTHDAHTKGLWRGVGEPLFSPNQKGINEFVSGVIYAL